jgi:thiol-disulfide isomerase/thioredoxin
LRPSAPPPPPPPPLSPSPLPLRLGAAPDFTDTQRWFNTPGGEPLHLRQLRGHVVIVDFWAYTCINCIRSLPFLKGLYATYHRDGLDIVGVETYRDPERAGSTPSWPRASPSPVRSGSTPAPRPPGSGSTSSP